MDLILWRHAEAEEIRDGQLDSERVLTPKGRRQATQMALWLRGRLPTNTRILVSPARRTQETATHLGLPYATEPRLAIGQSVENALLAAGWPEEEGTCLLIGHQPMLGKIVGQLLQSVVTDWPVKKSGIWWFSMPDGDFSSSKIAANPVVNCVVSVKDIESRKKSGKG